MTDETRKFDFSLDIDASREEVWDALTKAEELVRWFPLHAEVKPGVGGSMHWAWGDAWSAVVRIDAWDPPRLLRLVDENARPYNADGQRLADEKTAPARVVVDVTLETISGKTRLRLVHSGFGRGAAWDDELDGVSMGWQFELRSLRHYLTRFRGRDRHVASAHGSAAMSADQAWSRMVGPGGITLTANPFEIGQRYVAVLPTGDRFTGTIELHIPGREFFGTAAELGDGIFRLGTYPAAGRAGFHFWAASYEPGAVTRMRSLQDRAQAMLDKLFASARPS